MGLLASRGLRKVIAERFADGELHTLDEVVATCGHLVPPEIAVRKHDRMGDRTLPVSVRVERGRRWAISIQVKEMGAEACGGGGRFKWQSFRLAPGAYGVAKGRSHYLAKLDDDAVREMRRRYEEGGTTMQRLADEFGVGLTTVRKAVRKIQWAHVP